jgi:hypothetical protein
MLSMLENHKNTPPSNIRQGRFIGMPENVREEYLKDLKKKITDGYFYKDTILSRVADELAPTYAETMGGE